MQIMDKGQSTMEALMGVPVVIIGIFAVYQILGPIIEILINNLDLTNSAIFSNVTAIKVLVSLIAFVIMAMVLVNIVQSFRQPRIGQPGF